MSIHTAIRCFEEELSEADPASRREQHNLCKGLLVMAEALMGIEEQNAQIVNALNQIGQRIRE